MDNSPTESGTLVWIQVVAAKLAAGHPTDRVDKVPTVQIFEPVLVRVMGVGMTIEVICRRILAALLVMCILKPDQYTCNDGLVKGLTRYPSLLNIKGVIALPALERVPACPQTRTAAQPLLNRSWVPGIVRADIGMIE